MSDEHAKKYLGLAAWLRTDLPSIPTTKPKIWEAWKKHAGYYSDVGSHFWNVPVFLTWGFPPTLKPITDYPCEKDGDPEPKDGYFVQHYAVKAYGATAPDGSEIWIANDIAQGGLNPNDPYDIAVTHVLEVTVLHELIHWYRWSQGKDVFDENPTYAFEKEAYGHIVRRTWQTCASTEFYILKDKQ
jgi:hypothetical protein